MQIRKWRSAQGYWWKFGQPERRVSQKLMLTPAAPSMFAAHLYCCLRFQDLKGSGLGMFCSPSYVFQRQTELDTFWPVGIGFVPFAHGGLWAIQLSLGTVSFCFFWAPNSLKLTKKLSEKILDLCIIKYHTHCVQKIQVQCRMKQSIFTYLHSIHGPTISFHDYASLFKVSWAWWHLAIKCQARHVFHVPCRSGL